MDLLCLLETKLHSEPTSSPNLQNFTLFPAEASVSNFNCATGGRIWIKWNSERLSFTPISMNQQLLHGSVSITGISTFLLTYIYAENEAKQRTTLWNSLRDLANGCNIPWVVMGDFNCVLSSKDKVGGNPISLNNSLDFKHCINDCELIELPSSGLFYTWSNQQIDRPIMSKLDRALCNTFWLETFPTSFYKVTPPLSSDHSPIVVSMDLLSPPSHRFLFKNYWIATEGFAEIVRQAWETYFQGDPFYVLSNKLRMVKRSIKNTKLVNIPLKRQMDEIILKQVKVMKKLEKDPYNHSLLLDAKETKERYTKLSNMESTWLKQRAKAHWLIHSDDDIKFLYDSIKERRNSNIIRELQNSEGSISDPNLIADEFCNYFTALFNSESSLTLPVQILPLGKQVPAEHTAGLEADISDQEIQIALKSICENKSPGPDGFNSKFFTAYWDLTGSIFLKAAHFFFNTLKLPRCFKHTLITLISKVKHSTLIEDYRPISLCNTFYKVIAKVLAGRLKIILPFAIDKAQSAFIKGREISDNLAMAYEICNEFKASKKFFFLAKLDLRKAIDKVNRVSLLHRLLTKGIPERFVKWIEACIMDIPFSIVLNGSIRGFFSSSNGLRQGCPLSPFLFTFAMDTLSCLIEKEVNLGSTILFTPETARYLISCLLMISWPWEKPQTLLLYP